MHRQNFTVGASRIFTPHATISGLWVELFVSPYCPPTVHGLYVLDDYGYLVGA